MKLKALLVGMLMCGSMVQAQDDPTIMTINGQPVSRSEFEYSYNKNNSEGVIDKKTVDEYVDLFVNYKLKVQAALDEKFDTLSSFKKEFLSYRDQQIRPSFFELTTAMAFKYFEDMKVDIAVIVCQLTLSAVSAETTYGSQYPNPKAKGPVGEVGYRLFAAAKLVESERKRLGR